MVEGNSKINRIKQICKSRFSRLILVFAVADVALISYMSFGYIVPSHMHLPHQNAMLGRILAGTAKPSPVVVAQTSA